MTTAEDLTVVRDGAFVPGVLILALGVSPVVADLASRWPGAAHVQRHDLSGPGWWVSHFALTAEEVTADPWPQGGQWAKVVLDVLGALVDAGSEVAWIAADEGAFLDPPSLFHPSRMADSVVAWATDERHSEVPPLTGRLRTAPAEEMAYLHQRMLALLDDPAAQFPALRLLLRLYFRVGWQDDFETADAAVAAFASEQSPSMSAVGDEVGWLLSTNPDEAALARLLVNRGHGYYPPAAGVSCRAWLEGLRRLASS